MFNTYVIHTTTTWFHERGTGIDTGTNDVRVLSKGTNSFLPFIRGRQGIGESKREIEREKKQQRQVYDTRLALYSHANVQIQYT